MTKESSNKLDIDKLILESTKKVFPWKIILLCLITVSGVISMSFYKIAAAPDENQTFIFLVIFVEVAAGFVVFSQSILRRENGDKKADRLLIASVVFRLMVAGIGFVVFVEAGGMADNETIKPLISWTGFLTYEMANVLMFIIEWIFSILISTNNINHKQISRDLATKIISLRNSAKDQQRIFNNLRTSHEALKDAYDNTSKELKAIHERHAKEVQELMDSASMDHERLKKDLEMIAQYCEGTSSASVDPSGQLQERHKEIFKYLGEARKNKLILRGLSGKLWTARKNIHGWVCETCHRYNEANYSKPHICKSCNTEIEVKKS